MARYAIADIHGCVNTFNILVSRLRLNKSDTLFLLGDFINKGPDSKGVLDFIIDLKKSGYSVFCIRGNHDQMLLDIQNVNTSFIWHTDLQKRITLKSFGVDSPQEIPQKYLSLIKSMPFYIELENYYLVHAGFYLGIKDPFLDTTAMMNIKEFAYTASELKSKKIIHGHVPQLLEDISGMLANHANIIKIDGGCVYYKNRQYGNLFALKIDTREVLVQQNEDYPYEINIKK
jgi:serine/threonine protein phosphatase 1